MPEVTEEFELGWLYVRENVLIQYVHDPSHHLENSCAEANRKLHEAQVIIKDILEDHHESSSEDQQDHLGYIRSHTEEMVNRLVKYISEYLSVVTLPSLIRANGNKRLLSEALQTWEEHKKRIRLLSDTLFPQLRNALSWYGKFPNYLEDRLRECYKHSVYSNINEWIRETCFARIVHMAKLTSHSGSGKYFSRMILEMGGEDNGFCSKEWEQPLIAFVESLVDTELCKGDREKDFPEFLNYFGWLVFFGLPYYLLRDNSDALVSGVVERIDVKLCAVIQEEGGHFIRIVEKLDDSQLEGMSIWIGHSPNMASVIYDVFDVELKKTWKDIEEKTSYLLTTRETICSVSCTSAARPALKCTFGRSLEATLLFSCIDVWTRFEVYFKLFSNDEEFKRQAKQEFRNTLRADIGRVLTVDVMVDHTISLFVDHVGSELRKGLLGVLAIVDLQDIMEDFMKELKRRFAGWLIGSPSCCIESFAEQLNDVKDALPTIEMTEIEQMVKDTKDWDGLNERFQEWVKGKGNTRVANEEWVADYAKALTRETSSKVRIATVRSAAWPKEAETAISMPSDVDIGLSLFQRYFRPRYPSRKLEWSKLHGICVISTRLFTGPDEDSISVLLSMPQFCVLHLFENYDEMSVEKILKELVREGEQDVRSNSERLVLATVKSLSSTQYPLLVGLSEDGLKKSDVVKINMAFVSYEKVLTMPSHDEFLDGNCR